MCLTSVMATFECEGKIQLEGQRLESSESLSISNPEAHVQIQSSALIVQDIMNMQVRQGSHSWSRPQQCNTITG